MRYQPADRNDMIALTAEEWVGGDKKGSGSQSGQGSERGIELLLVACMQEMDLPADGSRGVLDALRYTCGIRVLRVQATSSACISASAFSNQNCMPISRKRLVAVVRCSVARLSPARPWSLPTPKRQ
jgi:hypothetical protein